MSPRIGQQFASELTSELMLDGVALSVGWSGWIKNVHTNLFGAALSSKIRTVWHYAPDIALPPPLNEKLLRKPFGSREQTLHLLAMATLCLNVSLTDCDPMVNVESQALDRPCLRGNLNLDALEDHPYVAATLVSDPSSVSCIRDRINALLDIPLKERSELIRDYQKQRDAVSRARYREFLEL
jgi:hypothetical protein